METVATQLKRPPGSPRRATISNMAEAKREDDAKLKERAEKLSEALDKLVMRGRGECHSPADLAALAIPCFFHQRFDDAVNIEKILEEIAGDETMSHSTLMQTATGVREVSKQLQRRPIKRAVRNVMIVTKARDNQLVYLTRDLAEWLLATPRYGSRLGVNVYVDEKLRFSKRFDAAGIIAREPRFEKTLRYWTPQLCWGSPESFDLVLTLGGDGTVLYTSWLFQRIVPPVLSFSLGSLGFLTTFDFYRYREHLNYVMGGLDPNGPYSSPGGSKTPGPQDIVHDAGMRVNLRMRFTCTVHRARPKRSKNSGSSRSSISLSAPSPLTVVNGSSSSATSPLISSPSDTPIQFEVLNELVIDRGPSPYVSNLELFSGEENTLITVIQADGVIFSTPTGSTAYSLSAGGSLVHPDIPAILLTPICPHTLSFRPMLLNDTMALRVAVPKNSRATAYCSFDGKSRIELRQGDHVTINASRYPFPTVVGGRMEWIDSVSRTLRWNTREATQKGWSGTQKKHNGTQLERPARSSARRISVAGLDDDSFAADSDDAQSDIMIGRENDDDDSDEDADPSDEQFDIDINKEDSQGVSSKELMYKNAVNDSATTIDSGRDSPFRRLFSAGLSSTPTSTTAM